MDAETKRLLRRQQYKIVGEHSGVKLCHWMHQKLLHSRSCYKEDFYGIKSHRCIQMTPTVDQCNLNCLFCWRVQNFSKTEIKKIDEPEFLLEKCIEAQRSLISGFKGDERCDLNLWREACNPNQVAISLTGEPTFYPRLGEFIGLCRKKGMTTFLVTNGTTPHALGKLESLPTQIYVTIAAPNEEIYNKLCVPFNPNSWKMFNRTLDLLPSLNTRTVIRHTLVDFWNIGWEEEYAKMIERAQPTFVEAKAYMFVGSSRQRMRIENMPSHQKVREFSLRLADLISYDFLAEKQESRVVLLGERGIKVRLG